ncbi:50S ribosomal protein L4 [Sulfobacillus harzensis]|uniref:Large ribosomal subunit protein uL4 n=1 Tax=Sulfobacillus harzensis TaxID=2729629 RepID=A0A7Y0L2D0_9FIRM|nr:50S ribosomal protein L4 [Sulfobacillus harzensis]NMP22019.1 50S ribosomal protein L4 [Sulfobacillus harzensis]
MPTVNVYNLAGEVVGEMELSERVFEAPVNPALLHQAVLVHQANQRSGQADTKTRSEVSGGGRKPWRQKGTGRARAGTTRAPHWRHGGVVFGPHPRDYSMRFPKKMRRAAIRQALSAKLRDQELVVVDSLKLDQVKTRLLAQALDKLNLGRNVLLITAEPEETIKLSARNFKDVRATTAQSLDAYNLLKYHRLVLDRSAVEAVEGVFNA